MKLHVLYHQNVEINVTTVILSLFSGIALFLNKNQYSDTATKPG